MFLNKISFNVSAHAKLRRGVIDYFVNISLLDCITKLAISSAQFWLSPPRRMNRMCCVVRCKFFISIFNDKIYFLV